MIIRHDINPEKYFAHESSVPFVGSFKPYGDHAVLIHPLWLLTAAHVANYLSTNDIFSFLDGQQFQCDRIVIHPEHCEEPEFRHDLALVRLINPCTNIEPVDFYTGEDELDQVVTFFGRGETGDGLSGLNKEDTLLRFAQNRVCQVDNQWIVFRFDAPEEEAVLPLEGISGPGDSGGPGLLKTINDTWLLVGISSWHDGQETEGLYGAYEYYARISRYINWINSTINSHSGPTTVTH